MEKAITYDDAGGANEGIGRNRERRTVRVRSYAVVSIYQTILSINNMKY